MYTEHFGLSEKPFNMVPQQGYLYVSEKHQAALTYLDYALSEGVGFVVLTGEVGAGKTTLLRHFLKRNQGRGVDVAVIFNTSLDAEGLLRMALKEFGAHEAPEDKVEALEVLNMQLIDRYAIGRRSALVIDEAQNLTDEALEEVRMLTNLQTDRAALLQIVLVGQPELRERLREPRFRQLAQRVTVSYHLRPLTLKETAEYIVHRLRTAGAKKALFDAGAIKLAYGHTKGIPRLINAICDAALVYAFAQDLPKVTAEVVAEVIKDRKEEGLGDMTEMAQVRPPEQQAVQPARDNTRLLATVLARLEMLEDAASRLATAVERQGGGASRSELDKRDALVRKLTQRLDQERKRTRKLLGTCQTYQGRVRDLSRLIMDIRSTDPDLRDTAYGRSGGKVLKIRGTSV